MPRNSLTKDELKLRVLKLKEQLFQEHTEGEAWWGSQDMSDYYNKHQEGSDPFNWIKLHPLMDDEIIKNYIFDHAGEGETSLLMALAPEGVEMARVYVSIADSQAPKPTIEFAKKNKESLDQSILS